jgi:hypothetical protein
MRHWNFRLCETAPHFRQIVLGEYRLGNGEYAAEVIEDARPSPRPGDATVASTCRTMKPTCSESKIRACGSSWTSSREVAVLTAPKAPFNQTVINRA